MDPAVRGPLAAHQDAGLATGDSEKLHIHAQLHVYDQALLLPVPKNLGIDERRHIETTIHTHDATGVVHMEAPRPYPYTLGDLFAIWGVRFGAGTLGRLQDDGGNRVWVYVNGKRITDPSATCCTTATASPSATAGRTPSRISRALTCSSACWPARARCPCTDGLGRERIARRLSDALPGGENPLRAAVWELMRPMLSPTSRSSTATHSS
jgi:hypothetical protein